MVSKVSRPPKVFTLDEANSTLPLVSRILRDIVHCHEEIGELKRARLHLLDSTKGDASRHERESDEVEEEILRGRIRGKLAEIDSYFQELAKIGCECKDPKAGLVDFPAELNERIVYLCWKLGESEISHWHELEAGFAGRQAVAGTFTGV